MFSHDDVYAAVVPGEQRLPADTTLGKMLLHIRPGQRVLDVGCGAGRLAKHLSDSGAQVVGIERQPEAAALARRHCIQVLEKDLEDPHLLGDGDRFDVIVFADVLEHLARPDALLRRLAVHLARDGFILVSVPNVAYYKIRWRLLAGKFDYEASGIMDSTHLRFFTRRTAIQLLEEGGFAATTIDAVCHVPFGRLHQRWPAVNRIVGSTAPALFATQWVIRATPR